MFKFLELRFDGFALAFALTTCATAPAVLAGAMKPDNTSRMPRPA